MADLTVNDVLDALMRAAKAAQRGDTRAKEEMEAGLKRVNEAVRIVEEKGGATTFPGLKGEDGTTTFRLGDTEWKVDKDGRIL